MFDTLIVPFVVAATALVVAYAFALARATRPSFLFALLALDATLAALALWRMRRDGTLGTLLRVRSGDVARGGLVAALLYASASIGRRLLAPPGSPAEAWVVRIYLQLGEVPAGWGAYVLVSCGFVIAAALQELAWRGLVQQVLQERLGVRRGWLAATALYGAAHLPTIWLLAMPPAGPNPLIVLAALFCGSVWGFLAGRLGRLPPSIVSHAIFSYLVAVQLRLWA